MDRGFYSAKNINDLYRNRHKFIIGAKGNPIVIKDFTKDMKDKVKDFSNYNLEYDTNCLSKADKWQYEYKNKENEISYKNKCIYIHLYFDSVRAEIEKKAFFKKLKIVSEFLKNEESQDDKENFKESYFVFDKETNSYSPNINSIENYLTNFGYFTILSNHISDAETALKIYRNKDVIEKNFYNLKNRLDMKRTKVSSEESLEGKIFIQFVALIYVSYIHQIMENFNLYKNYSMASMLDEIDVIEIFKYDSKRIHYSETTKKQRDILASFDIEL